ncbi:ribonucleases P/MRP protein subunit POP1-domain-containing protein [Aspergillus ambiguus]|uniref:ribonuclease P/MRP protein subunit POP1 n=1 Tax=Aspergillus ambiguus TaxID=176160 RepID=UPI003CCCE048
MSSTAKRKFPPSSAARKRAKTYDARSLAVQSAEAALSASGDLDVASYLDARGFEIRALEAGIQRSKAALSSRAFQKVPRSLRRRTASHNVKRVPRRLRARAKREMIEDNTPTVTARRRKPSEQLRLRLETARRLQNLNAKTKAKRAAARSNPNHEPSPGSHAFFIAPRIPKIKKNRLSRPPPPDAKYRKRQRQKTWLPTHMFHAKRAHITPANAALWRFALPLSPTEKSYRPSHRARGARGAVAWDMSYMATIQLEGADAALEAVLRAVGINGDEAWGVKGRKWRAGSRSLRAWVFERGDRRRPIAPVTLVRCAEASGGDVEMVDAEAPAKKKKDTRKMFVRVHPSAFLQLWEELLGVAKRQNPPVMVEDLRFEIGSIDITGPGSTEALIAALRPVVADGGSFAASSPEATWTALLGVSNPSSLPQNALLAFSVSDPRLQFPPKTQRPPSSDADMQNLALTLSAWDPDRTQSASALFDRRARLAAARQLPSQKAINRRRAEAGPGQYPPSLPSDPRIPVMVLASRAGPPSRNSNAPGSWTVLLPWKCVLPVWYALMYYPLSSGGNPRFGGLKEQLQFAFESGEPWFPGDFPGTRAGWEWGERQREEARQAWEGRPKGRRVEFGSLDLGDGQKGEFGRGWACDWEALVHGQSTPVPDADKSGDVAACPPLAIHHLTLAEATHALDKSAPVPPTALVTVKISLFSRGTPVPQARIYRLPTSHPELRRKWRALAHEKPKRADGAKPATVGDDDPRQRLAASLLAPEEAATQDHLPLPPAEDVIGFVTSGNYNLSEGRGTGIGSILLSKVHTDAPSRPRERHMCIVRAAGERVGRLGYWELV